MNKLTKVSVVIPTLGGDILNDTIDNLNTGTIKPDEILICIPEKFKNNLNIKNYDNVKILTTSFMGQVPQRVYGFKKAKYDYVLQLDDDIKLDKNCLKTLIDFLLTNKFKSAVSPIFLFKNSLKQVYKSKTKNLFDKLYYFLTNGIDGYIPGIITKAGTEIGVNQIYIIDQGYKVSWLPGGCILHYKKNLIEDNYYPFKGKAYSEDLFHSMLIQKSGISMYIIKNSFAYIDDPRNSLIINKNWFSNTLKDYKSRKEFVKKYKLSFIRLHLFYIIYFIKFIIKSFYK